MLKENNKKIEAGIKRFIDSYAEGLIDKLEFTPRIKEMKRTQQDIQNKQQQIIDKKKATEEIKGVITDLEHFAMQINKNLAQADSMTKRNIIVALVKRIEIGQESINAVFRAKPAEGDNCSKDVYNKDSWKDRGRRLRRW